MCLLLGDKPVMLGANSWVVKSLTEIRNTDEGNFIKAPLIVHYLPTANTLVGVHIPFVNSNFDGDEANQSLGDIELLAKYQFYRKDGSLIAGYESLKYGISNELGYNIQPSTDMDELRYKLSFGLPLMKPTYPVKKVNLYFEYQSSWWAVYH